MFWPAYFIILAVTLGILFHRSFDPDMVHFSNDGPLGAIHSDSVRQPDSFLGTWSDLNSLGGNGGSISPEIGSLVSWLLGPLDCAKFLQPISLFILGIGAWAFFRQLQLSPTAATLGGLAAVLNTTFFSDACWGLCAHEFALGMNFFALSLILSITPETRPAIRWPRLALAGLFVGMNVIEAADIGALYSMVVAIIVFYKALIEPSKSIFTKSAHGILQVAVVAVFAGFMAFQTVSGLVSTQIQGIAGTAQNSETKVQHWDFATQWSLPKKETLGLVVPGVFGYRMDTPKDMMPQFQKAYEGGVYWGGVGRDPTLDRFFDSGGQGTPPPSNFMRFSGGANYSGILVILLAFWAVMKSLQRENSPFSGTQKKFIWFWAALALVALPLAWGRFAPGSETSNGFLFYALLYKLPYFSTIRNPIKFLNFFSLSVIVLFAYAVHALSLRQSSPAAGKPSDLVSQLKYWWARATSFDRKWAWGCAGFWVASVLGCLIYASEQNTLVAYLQKMGFPDENSARQIAAFSLGQLGWFVALLTAAIVLVTLTIAGYFSGARAKVGAVLLGAFLVFDLGRANLPYIIHWDYKQKYEVGTLNPILEFLRQQPYEHRVAGLPFRAPPGLELFDEVYRIEWMQHHFPYYNIQCLDIIQMPRMPEDLKTYLEALSPRGTAESEPLIVRQWQLTNTRYLLGAAGYLDVMNQQLDPVQKRFRIVQTFDVSPKPGILQAQRLEELTAVPADNGRYALFEFTGALPRAKLYSNWQVSTNDQANLKTLADLNFDPAKTVLISTPQKDLPASATNENSGTVEFTSYTPKKIVFAANATAPSVLLLNDKYDPHWRVTVDGQPAELLRCNYLMRGVQVPPGQHTVEFDFSLPSKPMYVTLAGFAAGLCLCGFLLFSTRRTKSNPA